MFCGGNGLPLIWTYVKPPLCQKKLPYQSKSQLVHFPIPKVAPAKAPCRQKVVLEFGRGPNATGTAASIEVILESEG
jgi:hypothetical protein